MLHKIVIIGAFILSTKIFNYISLTGTTQRLLLYPLFFIMLITVISKKKLFDKKLTFRKPVLMMMVCMILSSIPCYVYFGQSFSDSLLASLFFVLPFFSYYYLHCTRISEKFLLRIFFWMSIIAVTIQIIQQLYPNIAIFGLHQDDTIDTLPMRNGLYRFRVNFNGIFTFPILFFLWNKILKKFSLNRFIYVLLFLASIYLALTRQVYVTVALCLVLSVLIYNKTIKKRYIFLSFAVLSAIVCISYESLFTSFIERSITEIDDEDYIRYSSSAFFYEESLKTPLNVFLGHGIPKGGSSYDAYVTSLAEEYHFYSTDVGFIGAAYNYGYIFIIIFYIVQFLCIFKYKKVAPPHAIITIIGMTIYSVLLFVVCSPIGAMVWSSMLYIVDLHKNESPLRLQQ